MKFIYKLVLFVIGLFILYKIASYLMQNGQIKPYSEYVNSASSTLPAVQNPFKATTTDSLSEVQKMLLLPMRTPTSNVYARIAYKKEDKIKGLGGLESIKKDEGMLFVFDNPVQQGFWMKDMNFPIDIIWIDQDKKVIGINENTHPNTYPNLFLPSKPASYVLEVNAGISKAHNIATGTTLLFDL
jgi:uncharacterized membrane protein (UPF0127 family)